MIKFRYPKIVLEKMRRRSDEGFEKFPVKMDGRKDLNRADREDYVRSRAGLNRGYLQACLDEKYVEPSGRVLKNLGFEIYIKDLETGVMEKVEFAGRCEMDHSQPTNPRFIGD